MACFVIHTFYRIVATYRIWCRNSQGYEVNRSRINWRSDRTECLQWLSLLPKRIFVPVHRSPAISGALCYAASIYSNLLILMISILNAIEWTDEDEESGWEACCFPRGAGKTDVSKPHDPPTGQRVSKDGQASDPATKIVEMTEKLKMNLIVMGATGLSNNEELRHVTRRS